MGTTKMAGRSVFLLFAFAFLGTALTVSGMQPPRCEWQVKVTTGNGKLAGTWARIGMQIFSQGQLIKEIENLRNFGRVRRPKYKYFNKGRTDFFRFTGPCDSKFCRVRFINYLNANPVHPRPGWFLVSADVEILSPDSRFRAKKQANNVRKWLDYSNSRVEIDYCQHTVRSLP